MMNDVIVESLAFGVAGSCVASWVVGRAGGSFVAWAGESGVEAEWGTKRDGPGKPFKKINMAGEIGIFLRRLHFCYRLLYR